MAHGPYSWIPVKDFGAKDDVGVTIPRWRSCLVDAKRRDSHTWNENQTIKHLTDAIGRIDPVPPYMAPLVVAAPPVAEAIPPMPLLDKSMPGQRGCG